MASADLAFFENSLQADFSQVRLHTDAQAAISSAQMATNAFSQGEHIGFGAGQYQPGTSQGRKLLAHELSHVMQQRASLATKGGSMATQSPSMSSSGAEQQAQAVAGEVSQTAPQAAIAPEQHGSAAPGVYCEEPKKKPVEVTPAPVPVPAPEAAAAAAPAAPAAAEAMPAPDFIPRLVPQLRLNPMLMPGLVPPLPSLTPPGKMDSNSLLSNFSLYGRSPASMGIDIHADFTKTAAGLQFFDQIKPGLSATYANMGLSAAYSAMMARDYPSVIDKSNLDWKANNPDEKRLPPLPVNTLLQGGLEAITGKKFPFLSTF